MPVCHSEPLADRNSVVCLTDSWASVDKGSVKDYLTDARHRHGDTAIDELFGSFDPFLHSNQGACRRLHTKLTVQVTEKGNETAAAGRSRGGGGGGGGGLRWNYETRTIFFDKATEVCAG